MILSIISIVLAVCAIVYCGHCAIVFQRFNDGIKDWANSLDESTKDAIDRSARQILRELDERLNEQKALERQELDNENVELLNDNEDE